MPLVWDFFAISTYLTGSTLFLLLPLIPDLALLRDQMRGWRKRIYAVLALGWQGTTKQWHRLEAAMQIMAIAIVRLRYPSTRSCLSTFRCRRCRCGTPRSLVPYFRRGRNLQRNCGADSGMAVLSQGFASGRVLHPVHFQNLGKLLLMMSLLWAYFIFAERLTTWYGNNSAEMQCFGNSDRRILAHYFGPMVFLQFRQFPFLCWRSEGCAQ